MNSGRRTQTRGMEHETLHISFAIDLVIEYLKEMQQQKKEQWAVLNDGHPISYKKAFEQLDKLKKRGYKFVPPCDNVDDDGSCRGHKEV